MGDAAGQRRVAEDAARVPQKDLPYVQESRQRLEALQHLCHRYHGTPYADQIKAVLEKTKRIHTYLLEKQKPSELEVFHLQYTDHFISTYTAIVQAHAGEQHKSRMAIRAGVAVRKVASLLFRSDRKEVKAARQKNQEVSEQALQDLKRARSTVPRLLLPQIAINTYTKITYLLADDPDNIKTREIGFTSAPEEKEFFLNYLTEHLGIHDLSYVGNALLYLPSVNQASLPEMTPVIHWSDTLYAVCLTHFRLYPVSRNGRGA
ncbi:hypothetical protein ACXYMU_08420 [Pontibacter sp. CAU 1760]